MTVQPLRKPAPLVLDLDSWLRLYAMSGRSNLTLSEYISKLITEESNRQRIEFPGIQHFNSYQK